MGLFERGGGWVLLELGAVDEWGRVARGRGEDVLVSQGGDDLRGGGSEADDTCGEPGLGSDGDLGRARGHGVEDGVGGVLGAGGDEGRGRSHREPLEFFLRLAGELGLDGGAGAHEAGADGGDADAFEAELGVEAFGEAGEGELAGDVGEQMGDGDFAANRGDVDDGCAAVVDL